MTRRRIRPARYRATLDRIGWALATGAGAGGAGAALVGWESGASDADGLVIGMVGAIATAGAIVALGGPLWWLSRRRGPAAAGTIGAVAAPLPTIAVLTRGFGAGIGDGALRGALWTSALAMGAVAAFLGGLLALAMWLIAYRPVGS